MDYDRGISTSLSPQLRYAIMVPGDPSHESHGWMVSVYTYRSDMLYL